MGAKRPHTKEYNAREEGQLGGERDVQLIATQGKQRREGKKHLQRSTMQRKRTHQREIIAWLEYQLGGKVTYSGI